MIYSDKELELDDYVLYDLGNKTFQYSLTKTRKYGVNKIE